MSDNRVTRGVSLPVWRVIGPDGEESDRVLDVLRPAWRLATDLANWGIGELVRRDVRRTPEMKKLPPYNPEAMFGSAPAKVGRKPIGDKPGRAAGDMKVIKTLSELRTREGPTDGWDGASQSAISVLRAVERTWKTHPDFGRFAVIWKGSASAAFHRFPYPFPVPNTTWTPHRDERGRPCLSASMPGGRATFVLAAGAEFRRQMAEFDALVADPKRRGELKLCGRSKRGRLVGAMARMAGSFDVREKTGTLAAVIRTDPNALLVVEADGRQPWILNRDDLRHLQACHRVYRQRMAEDLKHEKRNPRRQRRGMVESLGRRCEKHAARMDTALHQVSAQIAGYVCRCGVGTVAYDDSEKSYMPDGFPWAKLFERVRYKLAGMGVEVVSGEPVATERGE